MNIKPLKDNVLIIPDKPGDKDRKTKGGIYLPQTHTDKVNATQGKVLAVGSEVKDVKVGDIIIFNHRVRIILNDDLGARIEYFFIKEENVLGIKTK